MVRLIRSLSKTNRSKLTVATTNRTQNQPNQTITTEQQQQPTITDLNNSANLRRSLNRINSRCKQLAQIRSIKLSEISRLIQPQAISTRQSASDQRLALNHRLTTAQQTLNYLRNLPSQSPAGGSDVRSSDQLNNQVGGSKIRRSRTKTTSTKTHGEKLKAATNVRSKGIRRTNRSSDPPKNLPEDFYLTLATDHLIRLDPSIEQVQEPDQRPSSKPSFCFSFSSSSIPFEPVRPIETQPKIPTLSHGLSRVLFNPGVHWLQDPRTNVYNFDHRLQTLVSPEEFDFESLNPYVTSSRDEQLIGLANENGRRFCGSTSSMTQTLSQIYLMLNGSRPLNVGMLTSSAVSSKKKVELTPGAKMAASIRLKYDDRSQKYSIDSDKSFEVDEQCPDSTILSNLGQILEKFFVLDHDRFKRLLKSHKNSEVEDDDKIQKKRETYAFAKTNLIMTRSQLDCFNDYLPGNGTFDIKTRATIAIRHDRLNHANAAGYHIRSSQGPLESFEREYLDLIRSAFLKYQFQARIGQMDGCFVAYHNTQRVFGFEYIPISKMDQAIFGTTEEADKVFRLCLGYMERILEDSTKLYPEQSLRITTFSKNQGKMWVFVSPDDDQRLTQDPPRDYKVLEYQNYNYLNGVLVEDQNPIDLKSMDERYFDGEERRRADWSVYSQVWRNDRNEELDKLYRSIRKTQFAISQLVLPEGVDRQLLDVVLDWPSFSKQGSKMVNRPEKSQNEEASIPLAESDSEDVDDDLSVNKKAWKVSDSYQGFRPTPGVKYRTGTSDLVKKLRSIAKDGWNIQKDLIDAQKGQKVITIAPVEYLVEDWDKQKKS